jgi:hypothetical protein
VSAYGYTDGQAITGWLGVPLVDTTGLALGAGTHVDGPFSLTNFASIIVAIKPTGGPVTVKVKQAISGGPASLVLEEDLVVTAGETVFQAFVLFGDSVTVELDGSVGGTTVDYAVYPSNTTTNAQVIQAATINVQHNDALVGTEQTLDFEDASGFAWVITDDGPNQRVKIAPPVLVQPGMVELQDVLVGVGGAAAVNFTSIPTTYRHLLLRWTACDSGAAGSLFSATLQLNGDTAANYDFESGAFIGTGAGTLGFEAFGNTSGRIGIYPGSNGLAAVGGGELLIPAYADATFAKTWEARSASKSQVAASGMRWDAIAGFWRSAAAINAIKLLAGTAFVQGSRFTLYGLL